MTTLTVNSHKQVEMIDITDDVINSILQDDIVEGLAVIYTPHTTAAITINENADPDVSRDIIMGVDKLVPMHDEYRHLEGNSAAHIKSSLFGASETLVINQGKPVLGTWQGIYFCEFDGPRQRRVHIQTLGR